jgi:hypothetical protein
LGLRRLGLVSLLWLTCAVARAEPLDDAASPSYRAPTAAEVISQLYQFDQFQQNAVDNDEFRATQAVANTAAARADAAVKRDQVLSELQRQIGAEPTSDNKAAAMRAHALLGVESSDGPDYVRHFYAAQLAEYETTVALLERYLQSPDNDDVRSFASTQLVLLRSELIDSRSALADR